PNGCAGRMGGGSAANRWRQAGCSVEAQGATHPMTSLSTAARLEAMTDRALFERLATSVLRKADPRYALVIHTGINAQGETIPPPIDGLPLIPHSEPPHYVFVQHTTTDRERLRGKWLVGAGADLPKASAEAVQVRLALPQAVFTVVLCTNQRV